MPTKRYKVNLLLEERDALQYLVPYRGWILGLKNSRSPALTPSCLGTS